MNSHPPARAANITTTNDMTPTRNYHGRTDAEHAIFSTERGAA